ncbi:MAG: sialidase family protein [Nitrospirota bacterium]
MDLKLFTQTGMFPGVDRKITTSFPNQSRSESSVAINPLNTANMIAVSKKFVDPALYRFTVEPMVTKDGGFTWSPLPLPVQPGTDGFTDPVVAFDHNGTAFVIVMPLQFTNGPERFNVLGMQVFRLLNNGTAWSAAQSLIAGRGVDPSDDKPWIACDRGASSPFKGRVYAVWGTASPLRVARSKDGGMTWIGPGNLPVGDHVPGTGSPTLPFGTEVSIDDNGVVHVVWARGSQIAYTRSTDGGENFEAPRNIVNGITPLGPPALTVTGSFAEFPNATFRVLTLATGCAVGNRFIVAWSDIRDGFARIYYHNSDDAGVTWTASSGKPLWPTLSTTSAVQQFTRRSSLTVKVWSRARSTSSGRVKQDFVLVRA